MNASHTPEIPQLLTELEDAYRGEGNSNRIVFGQWLQNMADDEHGTLRDSARAVLTRPSSTLLAQRDAFRAALEHATAWFMAAGFDKQPGGKEALAQYRTALNSKD